MAEHETLLSSLAFRFASHPENLAVEALAHILRASATARRAMVEAVTAAGLELPGELTFDTQVSSDGLGQPDLVGFDDKRRGVLIVEAKFWAGLTEHQPVSYLQQLPVGIPSACCSSHQRQGSRCCGRSWFTGPKRAVCPSLLGTKWLAFAQHK